MLYWLSSYCIVRLVTIMIIKMVVLLMAYCTCTALLFFVFCLYPYCICIFTWAAAGQSVSCKASLAALRLYGYFVILLCY